MGLKGGPGDRMGELAIAIRQESGHAIREDGSLPGGQSRILRDFRAKGDECSVKRQEELPGLVEGANLVLIKDRHDQDGRTGNS